MDGIFLRAIVRTSGGPATQDTLFWNKGLCFDVQGSGSGASRWAALGVCEVSRVCRAVPQPRKAEAMSGLERTKRSIAPNAKQKALAQLADLKKNGLKRSSQFEVKCLARAGARWQLAAPHARLCPSHSGPHRVAHLNLPAYHWQVEVENDVYDDVDEDQYQDLVKQRREDNFIEDDGTHRAHTPSCPRPSLVCSHDPRS